MNPILFRILLVILAFCTGVVLCYYIIKPYILEPLCLVNSNSCAKITYYKYNNSVLMKMGASGTWIWYNGDRIYVYGQPVGQICEKPYEAAYTINPQNGLKEGFKCVKSLTDVLNFYKNNKVKETTLLKRADVNNFDVYAAMSLLNNEGIINL